MYQYNLQKFTITPEIKNIDLGGYRKLRQYKPYRDVLNNIHLYIFRYAIDSEEYLLISLELLWIDDLFYQKILSIIQKHTNLKEDQVIVSCTHTHSAPYVSESLPHFGGFNEHYNNKILTLIADSLTSLKFNNFKTAQLIEEGFFEAEGLFCNRNKILAKKTSKKIIFSPSKNLDYEKKIRYIKIKGKNENIIFMNFSCHATFNKSNSVSADFIHEIRKHINNKLPSEFIFLQGFAGDQKFNNPTYFSKTTIKNLVPGFKEDLKKFSNAVKEILDSASPKKIANRKKISNHKMEKLNLENEKIAIIKKIPLTKNINLISINAEPSFSLSRGFDDANNWPIGYSNGMIGYLPHNKVVKIEKGYEYSSWKNFNCLRPYSQTDIKRISEALKNLVHEE